MGRIQTDFFLVRVLGIRKKIKKKSVRIRPIRPIRSPIVSQNTPTRKPTRLNAAKAIKRPTNRQ
jgi:hypothetical protein